MNDIRVHAERKCRKFKTPAAEFTPQVKYWYNRIHAYMDLLKLKCKTAINLFGPPQLMVIRKWLGWRELTVLI